MNPSIPRPPRRGGAAGWQPGREGPLSPQFPPALLTTRALPRRFPASYRDLYGRLTPAWDQRGDAISSRVATSGGESGTRRPPLRKPFATGDSAAPDSASVPTRAPRLQPRSGSPLKHLRWRLETEFENPPISGGRRSGPGQSRCRTAGLAAPQSLGAPGRAFRPHPPNCCGLGPLPLPGTWKPGFLEPIPAVDAGGAAAGSLGGGGRAGGQ